MYSQENYLWGLLAYGLGVLLLLPFSWYISRMIIPWGPLRTVLRLLLLVLLLTPVRAYEDMVFLAPAWTVVFFELLAPSSSNAMARAVAPMAVTFVGLLLLAILWALLRHVVWPKKIESVEADQ